MKIEMFHSHLAKKEKKLVPFSIAHPKASAVSVLHFTSEEHLLQQ